MRQTSGGFCVPLTASNKADHGPDIVPGDVAATSCMLGHGVGYKELLHFALIPKCHLEVLIRALRGPDNATQGSGSLPLFDISGNTNA